MELERVRALGVKPPQNLWEYKAVNPGRSLFLLYALKSSPRLGLLYLYLFDYTDSFLPFIHTICPLQEDSFGEDIFTKLLDLREPTWKQWREFLIKYSFLPYQLIAEFAWDWLEVHYWTSRFLIVNAMLLSVLELFSFWRIWSRSELNLSATVYFTGLCTSTQLLTLIWWSRKSDGWKPKCSDQQQGPERARKST
ncbi:rCG49807, isoform CRA_a [Rattus norvegicus]|uniref:RCG49807, isoform CRA_a n=1 Tax=Rattus norvegicus TaxID=10116 RepID=A6K4E5_RAT|nr:rCG49807, isoform CRA_a [Rattus norvegicus]